MPLDNSLNISPYFDDFSENKDFYRILFKPGVSLQTRELNQLQAIIQNQIERFGNHIFKNGTIVSGINFSYNPNYKFVKINDLQVDTAPVAPSSYLGLYIKSDLNLKARVVNYQDGFESKNPDLNTLYISYVNSSDPDPSSSNAVYTQFRASEILTVYDINEKIFKFNIGAGGLGFTRTDTLVVTSAITITGNSIAFTVGETITQATTGAKAVIVGVDSTSLTGQIALKIRPRYEDLTDISKTAGAWTMYTGFRITGDSSSAQAIVQSIVGAGATGSIVVDSLGTIDVVTVSNQGNGYFIAPHVTVKSSNSTATVSSLAITPQLFKAQITVSNSSTSPVGSGYAFSVTDGIIYQKGHFVRVLPQTIIVSKYNNTPNNVSVGFQTNETYISYNQDSSLYDNAANTTNFSAPGADRLKLTANLVVKTIDDKKEDTTFLTLVEWDRGNPYKEFRTTVYSALSQEFERRSIETSGDFIIDRFDVSTVDPEPTSTTLNANQYSIVVDPGLAYISGKRVETKSNFQSNVNKAKDTQNNPAQSLTLTYENYVEVNNMLGLFGFISGQEVDLYDTAQTSMEAGNIPSTTITPSGTKIGTARVRSLVHMQGEPGLADCQYKLYLFNISMNSGKSFRDVKSIYSAGAGGNPDAIADIVLKLDATTNRNIAKLEGPVNDRLIFDTRKRAVKTISNIVYAYKVSEPVTIGSDATVTVGPLAPGLTFYGVDSTLTEAQKRRILLLPTANAQASANLTGTTGALATTDSTINGVGTQFGVEVQQGDFIKFSNATSSTIRQVRSVTNTTQIILTANVGLTAASTANMSIVIPQMYPISLDERDVSVSSNSSGAYLTIDLKRTGESYSTLTGTANATITYDVQSSNARPVQKQVYRDVYVKIHTSNNAGGRIGPWCLGFSDVIRLKAVYSGNSTAVTTSDRDITKNFFIDRNSDENLYKQSFLHATNQVVTNNQFILVKLDVFSSAGVEGFYNIQSYPLDDSKSLSASTTTINTLEIPEVITNAGQYYDLRDTFDFRPQSVETATKTTTPASATLNPSATVSLNTDNKFFPIPESIIQFDIENYLPRVDKVVVTSSNKINVLQGKPSYSSSNLTEDPIPADSLLLAKLLVPAYPSLPKVPNRGVSRFLNKRIGNYNGPYDKRLRAFTITKQKLADADNVASRFSMGDINKLERRVTQLEKQLLLTSVEKQVAEQVIPSTVDPTLDRFKYGFFVDTFDTYLNSDTNNKGFAATIDKRFGILKPRTNSMLFKLEFDRTNTATLNAIYRGNVLMLPYNEEALIFQEVKTKTVKPADPPVDPADEDDTVTYTPGEYSGNISMDPSSIDIEFIVYNYYEQEEIEQISESPVIQISSDDNYYGGPDTSPDPTPQGNTSTTPTTLTFPIFVVTDAGYVPAISVPTITPTVVGGTITPIGIDDLLKIPKDPIDFAAF